MKAYPFLHKHPTSGETTMSDGMDLRDWFAGLAMQGWLVETTEGVSTTSVATFSYQMADAMMKQRKEVSDE